MTKKREGNIRSIRKAIGKRLRIARINAGLKQEELAQMLDISQNLISKRELGEVRIEYAALKETAQALSVPVSYFTEGQGLPWGEVLWEAPEPKRGDPNPDEETIEYRLRADDDLTPREKDEALRYIYHLIQKSKEGSSESA